MTSNLPNDILLAIFEIAISLWNRPYIYYKCLIRISHVSRRWRDLSLGTSAFWSSISTRDLRQSSQVEMFLERSKNAGLHLELKQLRDYLPQYFALLMERTVSLRVDLGHSLKYDTKALALLKESPAPVLKTLKIRYWGEFGTENLPVRGNDSCP